MIRVLITGGTFDKEYDRRRGELGFATTHLPHILETVGCAVPVELEVVQLIDSLDMGDADRARVVEACRRSPERMIVITHGTDTMTETARQLIVADLSRTIVLTGAMVPYTVAGSDALFNFGGAILAAQLADPGVWVVMHGCLFRGDAVEKDRDAGEFRPSAR